MKKITILFLGASIFYLLGAITVQYKLFPYPLILDFKNNTLGLTNRSKLRDNIYKIKIDLYNIYEIKQTKIVMLGDSITCGANWKELLNNSVVNRGIGMDYTTGFINRLNNIYKINPKYVFIMGGTNDIAHNYNTVDVTFKNYIFIIKSLQSHNIIPIVQSTLYARKSKHYNNKIQKLNTLLESYCKNNQIKFINLNKKLSKDKFLIQDYTYDGVHLNADGYKIWSNEIRQYLYL